MEYVKLKDITTKITKGTTPSNIGASFTDEGINYFRSEMLGKAKHLDKSSGMMFISESTHNKLKRSQIEANDILFSMAGIYLGKLAIVKDEDVPANTNQAVALIRFNKGVNIDYLYYFMVQKSFNAYVNCMSAQAAQPNINLKQIGNLQIALPTDERQKRIADILSNYDNLIENNNKRIKLLEQMAENLYKEWFVRFRFPGYEDVEFEEKKPRGWQVGTEDKKHFTPTIFKYGELRKSGSFVRGKNITAANMIEGAVPVISAGLQPSGYHNEANVYGASLTISASGANAGYLQYHLQDIWTADCSYYQDDATIWFVYNTLKYIQSVISNLQCGAAQPHVYPKNINKLCVLIPTEELIYKFNEYVKPYYDEIKIFNQRNQLLTKQRDMLLPRLMSGKLEV